MKLPLFPLRTVLFPGMLLPLHVFEPRYRALVRRSIAAREPFGVALIRSGAEVGPPADPYRVGTTARIVAAEALADGRFVLVTRGEHRYVIDSVSQHEDGYLVGDIRYLDEVDGANAEDVAELVSARFAEYLLARVATAEGALGGETERKRSPIELSFAVAARLIAVESEERQRLLELPTAAERLEAELALLQRETEVLAELAVRRRGRNAAKLN